MPPKPCLDLHVVGQQTFTPLQNARLQLASYPYSLDMQAMLEVMTQHSSSSPQVIPALPPCISACIALPIWAWTTSFLAPGLQGMQPLNPTP